MQPFYASGLKVGDHHVKASERSAYLGSHFALASYLIRFCSILEVLRARIPFWPPFRDSLLAPSSLLEAGFGWRNWSLKGTMRKIGQHTWKREWVCRCELYVAIVVRSVS